MKLFNYLMKLFIKLTELANMKPNLTRIDNSTIRQIKILMQKRKRERQTKWCPKCHKRHFQFWTTQLRLACPLRHMKIQAHCPPFEFFCFHLPTKESKHKNKPSDSKIIKICSTANLWGSQLANTNWTIHRQWMGRAGALRSAEVKTAQTNS